MHPIIDDLLELRADYDAEMVFLESRGIMIEKEEFSKIFGGPLKRRVQTKEKTDETIEYYTDKLDAVKAKILNVKGKIAEYESGGGSAGQLKKTLKNLEKDKESHEQMIQFGKNTLSKIKAHEGPMAGQPVKHGLEKGDYPEIKAGADWKGVGAKAKQDLAQSKQATQHYENPLSGAEDSAKAVADDPVGQAALAAAAIYAGYKIYQRFFSGAARACKGRSGKERVSCLNAHRVKALQGAISKMKEGAGKCSKSKDPSKCKSKIDIQIQKYSARLRKAQGSR